MMANSNKLLILVLDYVTAKLKTGSFACYINRQRKGHAFPPEGGQ
jgi:hypothetical protein